MKLARPRRGIARPDRLVLGALLALFAAASAVRIAVDRGPSVAVRADGMDLHFVTLRNANLSTVDLRRANLEGAELIRVDLRSADLRGANMAGVVLREVDLSGARLEGVNLRGAQFDSATRWPDGVDPGGPGARRSR